MSKEKKRQPNWSQAELAVLKEHCLKNAVFLKMRFSESVSISKKKQLWEQIRASVSSQGVERGVDECKKKWANIQAEKVKEVRHYKTSCKKTGGGPAPDMPDEETFSLVANLGLNKLVGDPDGQETFILSQNLLQVDAYDGSSSKSTVTTACTVQADMPMETACATMSVPLNNSNDIATDSTDNIDDSIKDMMDKFTKVPSTRTVVKKKQAEEDLLALRIQVLKLEKDRAQADIQRLNVETANLKLKNHILAYKVATEIPSDFVSQFSEQYVETVSVNDEGGMVFVANQN